MMKLIKVLIGYGFMAAFGIGIIVMAIVQLRHNPNVYIPGLDILVTFGLAIIFVALAFIGNNIYKFIRKLKC